ncbi:hypothetical protein VPNG_06605 [Cytospora leucostoma]|uniref:Myb-like domain-containing protein n=1 Tax=Cytospora leucostoma TaxID=1230097 RepID=A0A423WU39_9PEZI|nr:hypothetical protein VPNG_06605 [Cytospora leucostoma]
MAEKHEQYYRRLLCPGCSHEVDSDQDYPRPDGFRYLTLDEMKASGFRCQTLSCPIYIGEDEIFADDKDQARDATGQPAPPILTANGNAQARDAPTELCIDPNLTTDAVNTGSQASIAGAISTSSLLSPPRENARNHWTQQELDLLCMMKAQGCPWDVIVTALPRHTLRSAETKWSALKSQAPTNHHKAVG